MTVVRTSPPLSLDTVFEVLASRPRRLALYALVDAESDVTTLGELIEDVATLEAALDREALDRERYLTVGTDLYEWHLPVLAELGLVDCDARHETIRYVPEPSLERWVERARADELPE